MMTPCTCTAKLRKTEVEPQRGYLDNLQYLELLNEVKAVREHAKQYHKKDRWKCFFWHNFCSIVDGEYDTHLVCRRCGTYKSYYTD